MATTPFLSKEQMEKYGWTAMPRSFDKMLANVDVSKTIAKLPHISIPQTSLAQRIHSYAKAELPEQTFNHSMRVYYYGRVIISQHFPQLATMLETYFFACMLHDIGTTPKNISSTALSFEFFGGMLAHDLLCKEGAPKIQAESVAEAIIRHQDLGDTGTVQAVEAILLLATVFDNVGLHPHLVHKDTIQWVTDKFPRMKWTGCFANTIREEIARKPWAHSTHIDGFVEKVEANELMAPYDG